MNQSPPDEYVSPDPGRVVSQQCYVLWERHDPESLRVFIEQHGKIRVRVAVPRQKWPEPLVG